MNHDYSYDPRHHIIAIDKLGRPIDPVGGAPISQFDRYVDDLLQHAREICQKRGLSRVLIHVHGGLNTRQSSAGKAGSITRQIMGETGSDWHYPIFIAWHSGGASTYWEHLAILRQGRRWKWIGYPTIPLYLLSDFIRGIGRSIVKLWYQVGNDIIALFYGLGELRIAPSWKNADRLFRVARELREPYRLGRGTHHRPMWSKVTLFLRYFLTLPFKLLTELLVVDAAAEGAWTTMLHRIRNLFRPPQEYDISKIRHSDQAISSHLESDPSGALVEFLGRLRNSGDDFELTLVGHSMGAIVLNQSMRYFREDRIRRIVYMAPACSIREASDAIIPFLQDHRDADFHVLTLHPMAELEETNFLDLVPRGTLLEWIDNWYTTPPSHTYRRLGKWINTIQALHLFKGVRSQFTLKAFDRKPDCKPAKHGDFNDCPFWTSDFWDPEGPKSYP